MNTSSPLPTADRPKPPPRGASRPPQRIVLLGAGFSTRNMGVAALASSAIRSALHAFPEADIRLFDYAREPATHTVLHSGKTAEVQLVNIRFSKRVFLRNNIARLLLTAALLRLIPFRGLRQRLIDGNPTLAAIARADIVGSIAGGDSFSDIYGLGRLLYVSLPQFLVLWLGRPLILLPQTIGPFKRSFPRWIGRSIIRGAKITYARDRESLAVATALVGRDTSRLRLCSDMAFVLEPRAPAVRVSGLPPRDDDATPLVGLNVSGLLYMGGYTRDNMFGLKGDYRGLVAELIAFFVGRGARVALVPHVFGGPANAESDITAGAEIFRELSARYPGKLLKIEGEFDQHQIKHVISRCDFFLGSRMHACIAALSQCVPAIGLAYSRKFRGVYETIGFEKYVIDLPDHDNAAIIALAADAYERRHELREHLRARVPEAQANVLRLFSSFAAPEKQVS